MAVAFSMIASFLLSSTLVPVLSVWLFRTTRPHHDEEHGFLARVRDRYATWAERGIRQRWWLALVYVAICVPVLAFANRLGTELFPRVDAGQFQLRIRAPAGTQLERTEAIVREIDQAVRDGVGPEFVELTLANIGNPPWSYPVNAVYVWNAGPQEAVLLVALKPGKRPSIDVIQERLRKSLAERFPDVKLSFEAGDIVSQVLNFGAPTPINVTVSGNNLVETRAFTGKIFDELKRLPSLRDVQIPQALDYPTLEVNIDRERAGQLGVTVDLVGRSIVAATSSSQLTTPNFWTNPKTGIPYRVAVRVPENQVTSIDDVRNLPVMPDGAPRPLIGDVSTVIPGQTLGEVDHLNSQRMISVIGNVGGRDLGAAANAVARAIKRVGQPPRGSKVEIHGQVEQMQKTLTSLGEGLLLAIVVVVLLLAANYQSIRAALLVLSTVPAVLVGVVAALFATRTTLNVQSMMGAIMSVGVAVANAVLLITFARERRRAGDDPATAAIAAARGRLRPILMTSLAMIAGMIPMALGLGQGGEQSAPLGRAVIGGLLASMLATLSILPALYAIGERKGPWRSASLDPADPESTEYRRSTT
jgi:multidrug efflux pump subunit AcrB